MCVCVRVCATSNHTPHRVRDVLECVRFHARMASTARPASTARGDAPPFDFKQFTRDVVVASDQALILGQLPGWCRATSAVRGFRCDARDDCDCLRTTSTHAWCASSSTQNVAPIDDTPEDFVNSQEHRASTRGGAQSPTRMPTPTSPSVVGRYMSKVRALMMDDDDDDEDDVDDAGGDAEEDDDDDDDQAEFLVKPAKGVKPLVLKSEQATEMMNKRRIKKPVIIDDDDEDEEVIATQTESQFPNARASPAQAASPKRKRADDDVDDTMVSPKRPSIIGRAINAVVGMLSPLRSQPSSPVIGNAAALASPGLPNSVLVSPGSMRNIVGNVARSVLDDGATRQGKVEWGSASAYAANQQQRQQPAAKRSLKY